jgi:hypothetical protein
VAVEVASIGCVLKCSKALMETLSLVALRQKYMSALAYLIRRHSSQDCSDTDRNPVFIDRRWSNTVSLFAKPDAFSSSTKSECGGTV